MRWHPYRGLEEVKVKIKEEDSSQREAGNKNTNEESNDIPNKVLHLSIIEYKAVAELKDLNKKKIEEEVLKCLPFFFDISDDSSSLKGFPI